MVQFQCERGVARIFLNRPQKVNALDSATLDALADALRKLPMPVVARLHRAVIGAGLEGSGRAAWLVPTGEPIDAANRRWRGRSLAESIERFGQAYTISRAKAAKEH
jgi:hypothetical protein